MKIYRSKIDIWMITLVFGLLGGILVQGIIDKEWGAAVVLLPFTFIIYLMFAIKYVINDNVLEIRTGFMGTTRVSIADIKSVQKNNNAISSPAMSLKRLEIWYGGKFDSIVISPPDRDSFISELLKINPDIVLKN